MKRNLLTLTLLTVLCLSGHAQKLAVKTNALGLATFAGFGQWSPTPNLGLEVALWPRWTLDVEGYLNPFTHNENKRSKVWMVQPELRHWFCCKYLGHFIGLHGQYADYDFGLKKYNYQGWFAGGGLSYGYVLPLSYRWKLEGNLGFGYNRVNSDTVIRREGMSSGDWEMQDPIKKNYWGITRAHLSVIFIIR